MTKQSKSDRIYRSESRGDWLDRLAQFNLHFGRFMRDTLGILLIAFALMTFLELRESTEGALLNWWTGLIT